MSNDLDKELTRLLDGVYYRIITESEAYRKILAIIASQKREAQIEELENLEPDYDIRDYLINSGIDNYVMLNRAILDRLAELKEQSE